MREIIFQPFPSFLAKIKTAAQQAGFLRGRIGMAQEMVPPVILDLAVVGQWPLLAEWIVKLVWLAHRHMMIRVQPIVPTLRFILLFQGCAMLLLLLLLSFRLRLLVLVVVAPRMRVQGTLSLKRRRPARSVARRNHGIELWQKALSG